MARPAGRRKHGELSGLSGRLDSLEVRLSALTDELARLRELLRRHGIDPQDDVA